MNLKPLLAALVVPVVGSFALAGFVANKSAPASVAQATQTTNALIGGLVSAVASISDATPPGSTPETLAANSDAISSLLPKCQQTYGLIDATGAPLNVTNLPKGGFEANALKELLGGVPKVEVVQGNHLRTMVPLTNDMHANCMSCHTNYALLPPGSVVGAASFKVKL